MTSYLPPISSSESSRFSQGSRSAPRRRFCRSAIGTWSKQSSNYVRTKKRRIIVVTKRLVNVSVLPSSAGGGVAGGRGGVVWRALEKLEPIREEISQTTWK